MLRVLRRLETAGRARVDILMLSPNEGFDGLLEKLHGEGYIELIGVMIMTSALHALDTLMFLVVREVYACSGRIKVSASCDGFFQSWDLPLSVAMAHPAPGFFFVSTLLHLHHQEQTSRVCIQKQVGIIFQRHPSMTTC